MEFLSLEEAAARLAISRRRVQALVEREQLAALRIGGRWVVEASQVEQRRRVAARRGRPRKADAVWRVLADAHLPAAPEAQDAFRRDVRPRAKHRDGYVHPSVIGVLRSDMRHTAGGRDAADAAGLPVGLSDESLDLYIRAGELDSLFAEHVVRFDAAQPNVHFHVVTDEAWPFAVEQRTAPLLVAWLDLADRGDRAERLVRERLLRGDP